MHYFKMILFVHFPVTALCRSSVFSKGALPILLDFLITFLITSHSVGLFGPIDAVHKLCRHKVTQVLHRIRCGVNVVVATFSMVTETVSVLYTQIQTLDTQ